MFTGIVKGSFPVTAVSASPGLLCFSVELDPTLTQNLATGASIAVDGVCLTVTAINDHIVSFQVIEETLNKTTLAHLKPGSLVHIERSLRFGDEIGGHVLSGHVFGCGIIEKVHTSPNNRVLTIRVPPEWMDYILPKGFIAIDGASLTIAEVNPEGSFFTLHLIPETLKICTFGAKQPGDRVNIELDSNTQTIVNTVKKHLAAR